MMKKQYSSSFKSNVTCMVWLYIGPFGKGDVFIAENISMKEEIKLNKMQF